MEIYKSLRILAQSPKEQIKYLIELGTYPSTDELVLQFDDAYLKFLGDYNEGILSIKDESLLIDLSIINSTLEQMNCSNNTNIWNIQSLNEEQWNKVRLLALNILENDY